MTVAVCTPWMNHVELWPAYLDVIDAGKPDELWIVDNASDPPLEFAQIRLDENAGFAGGTNAALRAATTDVVVFLNNDVALTETSRDWLTRLVDAVEPGVLVGELRFDRHGDVDGHQLPYLDGWCLAGMREDLLDLDGFDEGFEEPSYYGDNDLSLRARAAGMSLREVRVGLRHLVNVTSDDDRRARDRASSVNREMFAARARNLLNNEMELTR